MSFIDNSHRGTFTANKEIVSLIGGIIFSFLMGMLVDYYTALGQISQYFTIAFGIIIVIISLHTASLAVIREQEEPASSRTGLLKHIKELFSDKKILQITLLFALYYASNYICTPFYSTYQIGELGLSLTFLSALAMFGSFSRICVSKLWGKIADKTSFASMIEKCLVFLLGAQLCMCFAVPANGTVMVLLYNILHGIALGGVNSALINLVFDNVPAEKRADSLAITQAAAGLTGFVMTLLASPVVSYIQGNGNVFLGIPVYAQQVLSAISALLVLIAIVFVRVTMINKPRGNTKS
jgi:Na+/melibiose symporter-like transporter